MKPFITRRAVAIVAAVLIAVAAAPVSEGLSESRSAVVSTVAGQKDVVGFGWSFWRAVKCGLCIGVTINPGIPISTLVCRGVCSA